MYAVNKRGFIALVSAIIISAVLMVVAFAGSLNNYVTRFSILDAEFKQKSAALAQACVDIVRLRLVADAAYAGPEAVPIDSSTCQIVGTTVVNSQTFFKVQAVYQKAYTNLLVSIDPISSAIVSQQEVGHF